MTPRTKTCTKCGKTKSLELFGTYPDYRMNNPIRRKSWCKECVNERKKQLRLEIKEQLRLEEEDILNDRVQTCRVCRREKAYSRFVYKNGMRTKTCVKCQKTRVPTVLSRSEVKRLREMIGLKSDVLRESGEIS